MKILLNNIEEEFGNDQLTVSEMLTAKKFTFKLNIVKVNGEFIPREEYKNKVIHDGDVVQMIYLMSGG